MDSFQANFDSKQAEDFWRDWQASGCTLEQLFYLLLEPHVPGGGKIAKVTDDFLDLVFQLANELPESEQWGIMVSRGIFRDPSNPTQEEIDNIMRLTHFVGDHQSRLDNQQRTPKHYPQELIQQIKDMTVDWPETQQS